MNRLRYFAILGVFASPCFTAIAAGQEQFDVGMLACVVQVQRVEPSQPKDASEDISASAYSSAFIIRDPEFDRAEDDVLKSRVFLVTAAHNLVDCKDVIISITATRKAEAIGFSMFYNPTKRQIGGPLASALLKPFVYFDEAEDIAIVEATEDWAYYLNSQPSKIVGALLAPKPKPNEKAKKQRAKSGDQKTADEDNDREEEEAMQRLPRGAIASAAGTIHESGEDTIHPAYSCTLSRYVSGVSLADAIDNDYRSINGDDVSLGATFKRGIFDRILNLKYLMVESMSITSGFSGSPVMISNDHFRSSGDIVGMVLGGQPKPGIGRSAWAMPSKAIVQAIVSLKKANDGTLKWETEKHDLSDADFVIYKDEIGRWIFNRDVVEIKKVLDDRFRTPYRTRFSIESRIEFKPAKVNAPLCGLDLQKRIANLPGRSFVFRGLKFDQPCLNYVSLLTPYFDNCDFYQTEFHGSVLSGATFYKCRFYKCPAPALGALPASLPISLKEIIQQPCDSCSPAAVIAPIVIDADKQDTKNNVLAPPTLVPAAGPPTLAPLTVR